MEQQWRLFLFEVQNLVRYITAITQVKRKTLSCLHHEICGTFASFRKENNTNEGVEKNVEIAWLWNKLLENWDSNSYLGAPNLDTLQFVLRRFSANLNKCKNVNDKAEIHTRYCRIPNFGDDTFFEYARHKQSTNEWAENHNTLKRRREKADFWLITFLL